MSDFYPHGTDTDDGTIGQGSEFSHETMASNGYQRDYEAQLRSIGGRREGSLSLESANQIRHLKQEITRLQAENEALSNNCAGTESQEIESLRKLLEEREAENKALHQENERVRLANIDSVAHYDDARAEIERLWGRVGDLEGALDMFMDVSVLRLNVSGSMGILAKPYDHAQRLRKQASDIERGGSDE